MTEDNVAAIQIKQTTLELVQGDITRQETDAIVNAANSSLTGGGGVDGAIHRAAGPELVKASRAKAPCPPGEAVITPGFKLPAKWVIHTVGPRYRDGQHSEAETLAKAYRHSLELAIEHQLTSIAFPSISTGAYGYPIEAAARVALETTITVLESQNQLRRVRFVLFSRPDYEVYKKILNDLGRRRSN
jgi:O-acetyl-ADP-ribose deacetylase (regulator of RNase III)